MNNTENKEMASPLHFGNMEFKPEAAKILPVIDTRTGEPWRGTVVPKAERELLPRFPQHEPIKKDE